MFMQIPQPAPPGRSVKFRRRRVAALLMAAAASLAAAPAGAQADAAKTVTLLVGFAPGGALDSVARSLAEELGRTLGQRVVVENKSGAGGNLATMALLKAPADGVTLLMAGINLATAPALAAVRYRPQSDLMMVSQVTSVPVLMLASDQSVLKTPADFIAASKQAQGGLKVGTGGIGTSGHLAAELLTRSAGIPYLHVGYRGGAPANVALLGGEVDVIFDLGSGALKGFIDQGRMRPLAVMQASRVASLPQVRSASEAGLPPETTIRSWQGVAVKAGTPPSIIAKLHKAVVAAAGSPAFRARAEQLGAEVVVSASPAEFQQHYLNELARWTALIKAAGIKAE
jgi:tripartite-type tricarboxylate transporter receptor subunit TctC